MIPKLLRLCAKHSIGPGFSVILNNGLSQQVSSRSLFCIVVLLASLTLLDSKAAVTLTETVYQNAIGDVAGVYSKSQEYGDQIILGGDSNHVISFYFEYNGQFEADGDETCILRFYANDGESILVNNIETLPPGTLIFESEPFAIFPDFNTASITDINVDVPVSFTWTVEFAGLRGISSDRAGLVLRHPPNIGLSFDDIWVKFGNGWAPYRFNGNPVANFACMVIAEIDTQLQIIDKHEHGTEPPSFTVTGPRDQTVIVYGSDDEITWEPLTLGTLAGRKLEVVDRGFTPGQPRTYRAAFANSTPMALSGFSRQQDGTTKMTLTGPTGMPCALQASSDMESWQNLLEFKFTTRPVSTTDNQTAGESLRFYRLFLGDVVEATPDLTDQAVAKYPTEFVSEEP